MSTISRIRGISLVVLLLLRLGALEAQEGLWSEERRLGVAVNRLGVLNVTPCISEDGLTLIYASSTRREAPLDLWIATRSSRLDEFGDTRNLENLNDSRTSEAAPSLSGDSLTLYFRRTPGGRTRGEILVSSWLPEEETFGPPRAVEGEVNTAAHETYPVISSDERTLYFSRDGDLYVATRPERDQPFEQVTKMEGDGLNTAVDEYPSSISSDGRTLFFARTDDFNSFAFMWMATRQSPDGPFGEPVRLPPPVNVGHRVFAPYISADWPAPGSKLYFNRCFNGRGEYCLIYEATWHPECDPDRPEECEDATAPHPVGEVLLQSASRARFGQKEFAYFFIEAEDFYDNDPRGHGASWLLSTDPASRWITVNDRSEPDPGAFASGGRSITNALFDSLANNQIGGGHDIQYVVRFDTPGTYYLYIRQHSPLGPVRNRKASDSFYYPTEFGENPRQLYANGDEYGLLHAAGGSEYTRGPWVWFAARTRVDQSEVNPRSTQNPALFQTYEITEDMVGEDLILEFDNRQIGAMLDAFLFIEVDSGLPPTDGRGPEGRGFFGIGDAVDNEFGLANLGTAPPKPPAPSFLRGDCNQDAAVDLADAVFTLGWLFAGGATPRCIAAADANGDARVDITDPVSLLDFLFTGGSAPVAPFPDCGPGLSTGDEELSCSSPPDCQ